MNSMYPLYSGSRQREHRPETEHEYFMRMARNLRAQRRAERRSRIMGRLTRRPHARG